MSPPNGVNHNRLVVGVTVGASAWSLLRGQLAWFREQGWDVTLVSTPDPTARQAAHREGVPLYGIPMHRGISPAKDLVALVRWLRVLRRIRPDAVNVGTPKAALLGVLAAYGLRVPRRLYVVRGLRLEGTSGPFGWLLWAMERLTMLLATDVLFVSRSLAEEAKRRRLLPRRKVWLIGAGSSNGVDADGVAERVAAVDRDRLRHSLGLAPSEFVVGFIGRITRAKGVDTLVRACHDQELDPRVRVLVIGSVEETELQAEMQAARNRVIHVPWTDDVWGHLPAMDVLCLPTRREGFPNVVLEAGAAGLPTITTRATGARDAVRHDETGLVIDIDDVPALVAGVNRLASDGVLHDRLGRGAQAQAFEEFRPARIWRGLAEILGDVLDPEHAIMLGVGPGFTPSGQERASDEALDGCRHHPPQGSQDRMDPDTDV